MINLSLDINYNDIKVLASRIKQLELYYIININLINYYYF